MAEIPKPFGGDRRVHGLLPGRDYRSSAAWQQLSPATAETLVNRADALLKEALYSVGMGEATTAEEPFYKAVLEAVKAEPNLLKYPNRTYAGTFDQLTGLLEALREQAFLLRPDSRMEAVKSELVNSEAKWAMDIRNAALQEAQARLDQEIGRVR